MNKSESNDIAIIGMSGIFPGANSIQQFRENLINGVNSIAVLSDERIANTTIDNNIEYRKSGFLSGIQNFDHDLFGISYAEAKTMDPHQRKILEQTFSAIENAGYNYEELNGTKTSVYLSDVELNYYKLAEKFDPTLVSGNLSACTAGRVSRFFNFKGAAAMIDTSCSSSMVALKMACNDLILSDADYAVVGGAQISIFPLTKNFEGDIGIISEDALVRPFAEEANGTVFSEAVVCFLLKKLNDALNDSDNILAVIKGVSVNQDAKTSASLTSPSVLAQTDVLTQSWKKAGVRPKDFLYIETHGTGTKLGDPIEFDGIQNAINGFGDKGVDITIGSVKSNIGHTVGVAGTTGLAKVVLSLKNRELYPSINFDSPNPLINFSKSNLTVGTAYQKIEPNKPKTIIAGISSFGLSGTNTHVVVEEWLGKKTNSQNAKQAYLYCLSALNEEVLKKNVNVFKNSIEQIRSENPVDVNYTLLTGRKHFPYRIVLSDNLNTKLKIRKIKEFIKSFILVTPFHKVESHWLTFFKNRFKVFSETVGNCEILGAHIQNKERLKHFSFQYALFLFFKEIGIDVKNLIGFGDGKLVTGLVSGKYSLKKAIDLLNEDEVIDDDELIKLQKFYEKEKNIGNLAFFEIGGYIQITTPFMTLLKETKDATLFTFNKQDQNSWDHFIELLFITGYPVKWKKYFELELFDHKKVELPSYQFQETRCWIREMPGCISSNLIEESIKVFKWKEEPLDIEMPLTNDSYQYVLLGNKSEEWDKISDIFKYREIPLFTFVLDDFIIWLNKPFNEKVLQKKLTIICTIPYENLSEICKEKNLITFNKVNLLQKLLEHEEKISKIAFVNECLKIKVEELLSGTTVLVADTLLKTALHEYKKIKFKNIHWYSGASSQRILEEILQFDENITSVHGNNKRFVPSLSKLTKIRKNQGIIFDGEYVIIGGAKGIGNEVAHSIAEKNNVNLSIIGRSRVDDEQVEKGLKRLRSQNGKVTYYQVDVSIENKLLELLKEIGANKKINGIVFSAGQSDPKLLREVSYKETIDQAKSKINGIQELNLFSQDNQLDFIVVFSSILAVSSSSNHFSYSFSNAYLNDYLGKNSLNGQIKVINWCGWKNIGLIKNKRNKNKYLLEIEEGLDLFWSLLELEGSEFFISKENKFQEYSNFFKVDNQLTPEKYKESEKEVFPEHTVEEILTKEISNILGIKKISLDEDYFDLGLHSLNGAQLISSLKLDFGLELEFLDLFNYPTISELSKAVKKVFSIAEIKNIDVGKGVTTDNDKYDLSHSQLRVWLSEQVQHTNLYNIPGELILEGDFDRDICEETLRMLVDYQPALRTIIFTEKGIPKQKTLNRIDYEMQYEDISFLNELDKKQQIHLKILKNRNHRFDLTHGGLFRFGLVKISVEKHLLTFCMHHIISDVWSLKLLQNIFLTTYKSLTEGKEILFDPKILNFPKYAELLNDRLLSDKYIESKKFFSEEIQLCYNNPLQLKYDFPIKKRLTNKADSIRTDFVFKLDQLKKLASKNKVSVFIFVITAFKCLLKNWTGGNIIPVGIPELGRYTKEEEKTIGFFVKEFPFVTSFDENEKFSMLLKKVKDKFLTLMEHKKFPVEGLYYEEIKKYKNVGDVQIYDVLFTWNQFDANEQVFLDAMNLKAETVPYNFESSNYNIWLLTNLYSDHLEINLIYSEELFKKETAMALINSFKEILTQVVTDIDVPIQFLGNFISETVVKEDNKIELCLLDIWKKVLKTENINLKNEFFQIGGNKDKAIEILLRINEEFQIQMTLNDFLDSTTISGLEAQISFLLKQKEILITKKSLNQIDL